MRYVLLVLALAGTACGHVGRDFQPGTFAVIDEAVEAHAVDGDEFQDCALDLGEICIPLFSFAEYTYLARSLPEYLQDKEPRRLKVVGSRGHYHELSYSLIDGPRLVKIGLLRKTLTVESSTYLSTHGANARIYDRAFIEENGLTSLYRPLQPDLTECYKREGPNDKTSAEVLSTPGAFVNEVGEVCYGSAVFLRDLPLLPSNQTVQTDQPKAGR